MIITMIDDIKTITIIGAGTMGHEIAQVALMAGFPKVILNDLTMQILGEARDKIERNLTKLHSKALLATGLDPQSLLANLMLEPNLPRAVSSADFIIEAIPEKMELKKELFAKVGALARKDVILATNTSTMSITEIASASGRDDKVIGMHFFTPIPVLRLIELIKGTKTSDRTFEISASLCERFPAMKGKRYIARIEKESPGFIVNRLTIASSLYLNWLLDYALEKGISYEMLDNDAIKGTELGPYAKWDYLGLDVVCNSLNYFAEKLSPEFKPGKVITECVKNNNLGRKSGEGLYEWKEGKQLKTTKEKANLLEPELYYAIQLNEGCRLLEEGIVKNYKVIDDTMLAGMDMPGPFGAGKNNYENWTQMLKEFSSRSGLTYIKPCRLMVSGEFLKMRK
jgi:enoyl-CoA hydratase/3-hydroxyacyl-CoA dehydrogenase